MSRESVPPPADLDAQAKRLWRATRKALQDQNTWRDSDGQALERYVRVCERARLAREGIPRDESGRLILTAPGSKGQTVQHPNVKTAREAERDAHEYARALLLTPESRRRSDVPDPITSGKFGNRLG
jgi:P27 family predicted phage terminase small subunit